MIDKEPLYRKRKLDFETESLRMWEVDKKKRKNEFEDIKSMKGFKVKYKDIEMEFCGFARVLRKKDKKLVFAYKFKHEEGLILIHNPKIDKKIDSIEKVIRELAAGTGYQVQDTEEILKNIHSQKHVMLGKGVKNGRTSNHK